MTRHRPFWTDRRSGASLIEVLVVMVVFLVGILAIANVFPRGLSILRTTKNTSMATQLARAEMERLKGSPNQMAEAILPVSYRWNAATSDYTILVDLNRRPSDLMPAWPTGPSQGVTQTGDLLDAAGNPVGPWGRFAGANVIRRVFGEGRTVPAPRFVPTAAGSPVFGGVMALQFAPVVADTRFQSAFQVYGNDLTRQWVEEVQDGATVNRDYVVLVQEDGEAIGLPQGPYRSDNNVLTRNYRLAASYIARDAGGNYVSRDAVVVVPVAQAGMGDARRFVRLDASALATLLAPTGGDQFVRLEADTVRVQRLFERVPLGGPFLTGAALQDDAAYQYQLLDQRLGLLLFNSAGFNYQERRRNARVPLQARVDYDVLDWRIIRDDFRVPTNLPHVQKLVLNSLKVLGNPDVDARAYAGLGFTVASLSGGTENRDFVLMDLDTGGIYAPTSYTVDYSNGTVTFVDLDNNQNNGLSASIFYPGMTTATAIDDVRGRSVRALYRANGEWSVQALKAASLYRPVSSTTLGVGQCYVGGSNPNVGIDRPTRLYFPPTDIGRKVVIGEAWYRDNGGALRSLADQEFLIRAPRPGELDLGYVDLTDRAPAVAFDFTNGYAVRRVRGVSAEVRVMWNPSAMNLGADPAANLNALNTLMQSMRKSETETFLMRGDQ